MGRRQNKVKEYSIVGKPVPRLDGRVKVTGQAEYSGDITPPNMLHGKILRSPHPHAKIIEIDTSKAEAMPGVKAVVTSKETVGIRFAFVDTPRYPADVYPLATDKVRYIGEAVAAVAAVDEMTAADALSLIEVEYGILPAVFDPEEAMKDGAPKVHEEIVPTTTCSWEDWGVARQTRTYKVENNICATVSMSYEDIETGFAQSDYIRQDRFYAPATSHAAMEPHVALASYDSGKLDVWLGHQSLALKQYWLAKTLGMSLNKVRVHRSFTGGAFGGKVNLFSYEFLAAFLSRKANRPVRIVLSREEVFTSCRLSHPLIMDIKTGVKRDGTLMAQHVKLINDPGAYRGSSPVVLFLAHNMRHAIYTMPSFKHEGVGVYTNKAVCYAKRGHGSPQMSFAVEAQLDMIAKDLSLDPAELRLKNVRKTGDVLPNGDKLNSCGLSAGIRAAMEATNWKEKRGRCNNQGIGIGLAAMLSGAAYYPFSSSAIAKVNPDGTVTIFSGQSEFGQGSDTALPQIAAEELGLGLDDIILVSADSELCPPDMGGFLSCGIFTSGEAVRRAAADAKQQLLATAAEILETKIDDLEIDNGRIYVKETSEKGSTFTEIARHSIQKHNGDSIVGRGFVKPVPDVEFYPSLSKGAGRWTDAYGLIVAVAEVEVDPETGRVKVDRITIADDCGFNINPLNVHGQMLGQAVMGIGDALLEEIVTEEGRIINTSFADYKIPGVFDMSDVEHIPIESIEPKGPFGGKEAGEGARAAVGAAIANAVFDAIGVITYSLPLTPEKILEALEKKAQAAVESKEE